jgi:hypothetical protein
MMNIDHGAIFSQCVYDVDNRFVDLTIRSVFDGAGFMLTVSDTSDHEETDSEIEVYLTRENLKLVIDRLTQVLEK